jgi:hypothetical protein
MSTSGGAVWDSSTLANPVSGFFGYRKAIATARSAGERTFLEQSRRVRRWIALAFAVFVIYLVAGWQRWFDLPLQTFALWIFGTFLAFRLSMLGFSFWVNRRRVALRRGDAVAAVSGDEAQAGVYCRQSRLRFLGLPLWVIRKAARSGAARQVAQGWIAFGDVAHGVLFASGGTAIGGIAVGGRAFGVVACGGSAFGLVAVGGISFGVLAVGGIAWGWEAMGGIAIAWKIAVGGVALSQHYALGGFPLGTRTNDYKAQGALSNSIFAWSMGVVGPTVAILAAVCFAWGAVMRISFWFQARKESREASKTAVIAR